VPTEAPSVLVMRGSTSRAARSARSASSAASSVETVQARCRSRSGNSVASWSASGRPAAGSAAVAGDVPGSFDRLAQGGFGKVGRRRGAAALPGVDRQVQRPVARLLNGFDVVLADRDGQSQAFGDFRGGVGGANLARVGQGLLDKFGKTRVIRRQRQG